MTEPSQSPIVVEDVEPVNVAMAFPDAIARVTLGDKITRLAWKDTDHYGYLKNGLLCLHKAGESEDTFYTWIVNDGDLTGVDWVVTYPSSN